MIGLYFFIGFVYCVINVKVRNLDTDGNYLLPFFWFLLWPLAAIAWFIILIQFVIQRIKTKQI